MKNKIQIAAGIISLVALLTYTLIHTGGLLARYIDPAWAGYVAALGIEIAIVSLSLRIGDLKRSSQNYGFFFFVLVSVVVVSALANIAEGFSTAQRADLTLSSVQQLDPIGAVIGLAATGLISLIVLALSEIIGSDVQSAVAAAERRARKEQKAAEIHTIETAREIDLSNDRDKKEQTLEQIKAIFENNPTAAPREVYKPLHIGRSTYYSYMRELETTGQITRNGAGEVIVS